MDGNALVTRGFGDRIFYVIFLCSLLFLITHFKYIPSNNVVHSQKKKKKKKKEEEEEKGRRKEVTTQLFSLNRNIG